MKRRNPHTLKEEEEGCDLEEEAEVFLATLISHFVLFAVTTFLWSPFNLVFETQHTLHP